MTASSDAESKCLRRQTMKYGIEDTIATAIRRHVHFDSMSNETPEFMWRRHCDRALLALSVLWQSLVDQLNMDGAVVNECRTAEENIAFLINCGVGEEVARFTVNEENNWGSY
jgi:hypothetical protein